MTKTRVCIIGAGPSGITAAKNCKAAGIDFAIFEKSHKVGGNWVFNSETGHSSVYENTHIISSKIWSEYEDFPMPHDYPDYPNHRQLQSYFEAYTKAFGIYERIQFGVEVIKAEPDEQQHWTVTHKTDSGDEQTEIFSHLMVANGHHWSPKYPDYEGQFKGQYLHSHDFKRADDSWRGKRVLVIGAGNSACDVAVETARVADKVCLSMRSPQWFIPKFIFGVPSDVLGSYSSWMPAKFKQIMMTYLLRLVQGRYRKYGLPEPDDWVLSQHPTANSDLLDYIRHGRIEPRPGIQCLRDEGVSYTDGMDEDFDIIVACTGFDIKFPFFDESLINFQNSQRVPLYLKMMHEKLTSLYFIGLFQPLGCIWPLADHQARLACAEISGKYHRPEDMALAISREMNNPHYAFKGGSRHSTEVDYHRFRDELKSALLSAGMDIGKPPKGKHYKMSRIINTATG